VARGHGEPAVVVRPGSAAIRSANSCWNIRTSGLPRGASGRLSRSTRRREVRDGNVEIGEVDVQCVALQDGEVASLDGVRELLPEKFRQFSVALDDGDMVRSGEQSVRERASPGADFENVAEVEGGGVGWPPSSGRRHRPRRCPGRRSRGASRGRGRRRGSAGPCSGRPGRPRVA